MDGSIHVTVIRPSLESTAPSPLFMLTEQMDAVFQIFQPEEPELHHWFNLLCLDLREKQYVERRWLPGPEEVKELFTRALEVLGLDVEIDGLVHMFWTNGSAREYLGGPYLDIKEEALHAYYTHMASVITAVNLCLTHDHRRAEVELTAEERKKCRRERTEMARDAR